VDNAIQWINLYPVNSAIIGFRNTYLLDGNIFYPVDSAIQRLNNRSQGFFGILLETLGIFLGFDCFPHLIIAVM